MDTRLIRQIGCTLGLLLWGPIATFAVELPAIIADWRPSLVYIAACPPAPASCAESGRSGTGFVVSAAGYVLTASHVIPGQDWVLTGTLQSSAGESRRLQFIGRDPQFDVALLKFADTSLTLKEVRIGNPHLVVDGADLYSMGFGRNVEFSAKAGKKSGAGGGGGTWISDIRLNPGDSGAPVFNSNGEVVAVVVSELSSADGIKFLLPISYATYVLAPSGKLVPTTAAEAARVKQTYSIRGSIGGTFDKYEPWSQDFPYGRSDGDCSASYPDVQRFCAPPGYELDVKNVGNLKLNSANCNSSVGPLQIDGSNCVKVSAHLAGCGYDIFPFGVRNCRGRGWIDYVVTLNARKGTTVAMPTYEISELNRDETKRVLEIAHPAAKQELPGRRWSYALAVEFKEGSETRRIVRVSNENPFVEGVASKMTDGTLVVTILR